MLRTSFLAAAGAGLIAALALPQPVPAGGSAEHLSSVRIGLVGSLFRDTPEPMVQLMIRPFKSLLESQTGVTGQVVTSGDADVLGRQLKDDEVQLGVFHGVEFAWARAKTPELKPLLIAVNEQRNLHALLVVRKDSTVKSAGELRDKAIALPRLSREHCRLFHERRCPRRCCKTGEVAPECATGDFEDTLDAVFEDQVGAAVVDAADFNAYAKLKPGRAAKLRVLQESEAFPCAVVAYVPGALPVELLERFREGMIAAKSSPRGRQLLEMCRITRFESVPPEYDQMLVAIAKAYPPPGAK